MISRSTFLSTSSSLILFFSSPTSWSRHAATTRFGSARLVASLARLLSDVQLRQHLLQSEHLVFQVGLLSARDRDALFQAPVFDAHPLELDGEEAFVFFVFAQPLQQPVEALGMLLVRERLGCRLGHGRAGHLSQAGRTLSSSAPSDSLGPPLGVALKDLESENSSDSVLFGRCRFFLSELRPSPLSITIL